MLLLLGRESVAISQKLILWEVHEMFRSEHKIWSTQIFLLGIAWNIQICRENIM